MVTSNFSRRHYGGPVPLRFSAIHPNTTLLTGPAMDSAAIFFAIVFACGLLPILYTRHYQSIWYFLLACVLTVFILSLTNLTFETLLFTTSSNSWIFTALFLFRYTRLVVHVVAFYLYKPTAVLANPSLKPTNVTVIIPSVEAFGDHFVECIQSVYANRPASIILVTAGPDTYNRAIESVGTYPNIIIKNCNVQDKRQQICLALQEV